MLRASVLLLKSSIRTSGLLLPWKIRPVADTMERRDAWKELEQLLTSITRLSNEEAIEKMTEFCPRLAICDIEYPVETLQRKRRLEERRMLRQHHENRSRNGKKKGEREQVTETVTLADDEATRKLMKSTLRILVARAQKNSGTSDREVVRDKMKKSSSKIIVSSSSATPAPLPSKSNEGKRSGADKKANRGEVDGTQNSKRKGEVEKSSDLVSSPTTTTTAAAAAAMNVSSSSTFPSGETPFRASSTASTAGVKGADTSSGGGGSACKTGKDFCTRLTRDSLFRNCGLPCDEPVVVAVSGGFSSMMLLHQLGILRTQNRIRQGEGRVTFELIPLHLREEELMAPTQQGPVNAFADEGDDARQENGRYCHTFSEVKEQFEELECLVRTQCEQWEFASTPLFTADEVQIVQYSDYLSPDELRGLREVLHHPRIPLSHRELLYRRLRGRILTVAAVESINKWRDIRQVSGRWYHMLTGENALRCCVATLREVMSNSNSNRIVHFGGHRGFLGQCMVMRPLRSLIPREAVIYCRLHGIQAGFTPSLSTLTALRSFDRTLEVFINIMLGSYRTSIFNVLNTVTRLDVGADAEILNVDLRTKQSGGPCGENTKQAKRVIAGKAAQHHREQLKMRRPICCLWEGADIKGEEEAEENGEEGKLSNQSRRLCVVCGCFITCADEHPVTLRFGRRFVCESCLQLMNDFANTRRAEAGTESERILTDPAVHSAVTTGPGTMLSAFESLTTTMQMLVAATGNSPSLAGNDGTGEDRCVRRRLSAHGAEEYILQTDDGEKDS